MSNQLQRSNRFQEDYLRYRTAIDLMPDGSAKQESQQLLNKLVSAIKTLDSMHMEIVYGRQLPATGSDLKQDIADIRKKLVIKTRLERLPK